jgi:hypothetical protein
LVSTSKLVIGIVLTFLLLAGAAYIALSHTTVPGYQRYRLIVTFREDGVQPFLQLQSLKRVNQLLETYNMSVSLGIMPNFSGEYPIDRDADLLAYLHEILLKSAIFEAAMYGVTGRYCCIGPLGHSEFAGLPLDRQEELVHQGLAILHSAFPGIPITTFIPPFHTYDENTLIAIRNQSLSVISSDDYVEGMLYGKPPPPPSSVPLGETYPQESPDLPTSQPFVLDGTVHMPANMELYNWTAGTFVPLEQLERRFELFYARPGSTFIILLHHYMFRSEESFQELRGLVDFINGHQGVKFMTLAQSARLLATGALQRTQNGWELLSEAGIKQTLTFVVPLVLMVQLNSQGISRSGRSGKILAPSKEKTVV